MPLKKSSKPNPFRVRLNPQAEDTDVKDEAAIKDLVEDFNLAWNKTVEGILGAGRALSKAQEHVKLGKWEKVVKARFGISPRTAQRLMNIVEDKVLSDPSHVTLLPRCMSTLDRLASLNNDEALLDGIKSGKISPSMTRDEAETFIAEMRASKLYAYGQVPAAVRMLLKYQAKHPDGKAFASLIVNYAAEAKITPDDLDDVAEWLSDIALGMDGLEGDEEDIDRHEITEKHKAKRIRETTREEQLPTE